MREHHDIMIGEHPFNPFKIGAKPANTRVSRGNGATFTFTNGTIHTLKFAFNEAIFENDKYLNDGSGKQGFILESQEYVDHLILASATALGEHGFDVFIMSEGSEHQHTGKNVGDGSKKTSGNITVDD